MTTLISILLVLALTAASVWVFEKAKRSYRRSNRANVRRIQRYLDQLPPADPGRRGGW